MSDDHFTVTSSTGWLSRIGGSLVGVLFGAVFFLTSFPVLFFNEGRAVETRKTLEEGAKSVIEISEEDIVAANEGKLVYLTGEAEAEGSLSDPEFMVTSAALKLSRTVEMYQWKEDSKTETRKKLGGGEEKVTTYSYTKEWSSRPIDSSKFEKRQGHENPRPALSGKDWKAKPITVGAFTLPAGLVGQIDNYSEVLADSSVELPETIAGKNVHSQDGGFFLGESPSNPAVGDLRVSHTAALPGAVSLLAKQLGNSFEPYAAKAGGTIEILETGTHSADSMFAAAESKNKLMTWILRLVGVACMFFGLLLLFRPLSVIADVLPIAGTIVGAGTGFIALLISLPLSVMVIASAWLFYRPLIGIPLIIFAVVGFVFLIGKLRAQKKRLAGPTPPVYRGS